MASGPKPRSARAHSARSACCGSAIVPNRPGQRGPHQSGRWPACVAHKVATSAWPQRSLGALEHARLARQPAVHARRPTARDRPRAPSGQMIGRCSLMALWLTHAQAQQGNAGNRASEQDGDTMADHTEARWWCQAAPVVGKADHASGTFSEVGGRFGTCKKGRGGGEEESSQRPQRKQSRGVISGSHVDQRTTEGGQ
jgi:hypothetical protein